MTLTAKDLHVFTARSNPLNWEKPQQNWEKFAVAMVEAGVSLTVIECAYGEEPHRCDDIEGVRHIPVRAKTRVWNKENLLNIGVHRTPEAQYIAWIDADVIFRRPDWVIATLRALQHYYVVQPWSDAYDLGPSDLHMAHHTSFCRQYFHRQEVISTSEGFWKSDGGPHVYPHSGYAWAMTRQAFDWVGGLFELGGMGSGDYHMALSLIGRGEASVPKACTPAYRNEVVRWSNRAVRHINFNVGYVAGTIEHLFHGRKPDRGYQSRWEMFITHDFDPLEDLKRNSHGVLEFASNKPELRHDFDLYLMSRNEDINSL
jgi:hypothetical protein